MRHPPCAQQEETDCFRSFSSCNPLRTRLSLREQQGMKSSWNQIPKELTSATKVGGQHSFSMAPCQRSKVGKPGPRNRKTLVEYISDPKKQLNDGRRTVGPQPSPSTKKRTWHKASKQMTTQRESSAPQKQRGFWASQQIGHTYQKQIPVQGTCATNGRTPWGTLSQYQSSQGC